MTEPRTRPWMPAIPGPLQRLFDHFPLVTYPPNELPARSPHPSSLPTLYVFSSEEDATAGAPSFNPSCLKWQTLLRLTRTPHLLAPSTNHASPTGSLPYLQPPIPSLPSPPPRLIPSSSIERYILTDPNSHFLFTPTSSLPDSVTLQSEPYTALLSGPIRAAWLTALYLDPLNAPLLEELYINPVSSSPLVRAAIRSQLRSAAEAEVVRIISPTTPTGGWSVTLNSYLEFGPGARRPATIDPEEVYKEAEKAWESLAVVLGESETRWFFGVDKPGVFDVGVFAYSYLVIPRKHGEKGMGLEWRDGGRLDSMVKGAGGDEGPLVKHREALEEKCWGGWSGGGPRFRG